MPVDNSGRGTVEGRARSGYAGTLTACRNLRCAPSAPPLRPTLLGGPPVLAVGRYRGPLRRALLAYKERGRRDLAVPLASLLGAALVTARPGPLEPWWLVPAPSRPAAARARGGDHVLRLCRQLARGNAQLSVVPALRLARGVQDSVGLSPVQRAANLAGRVRVRRDLLPPPGAPVLLVDDVVTTGATVQACWRALRATRHDVVAVLVLADATSGRTGWRTRVAVEKTPECRTCLDQSHSGAAPVAELLCPLP